ncbi:MAG: HD-GYP domain-containing protein [bacterium]
MPVIEEHTSLILQLSQTALAAGSVPEAVTPILQSLVEETAAVGAGYFQHISGDRFRMRASFGEMPANDDFQTLASSGIPCDSPLLETLRQARQPVLVPDTRREPHWDAFRRAGVSGLAAAPVVDNTGEFVGAFLMHTFDSHEWTAGESSLFASVATFLSSLAARLVAEEKASSAKEGAIRALGLALEYRDRETKGHTDRVTALSGSIARVMGIDDETREALRWGAYLHDIGKISIPDTILLKPGALDEKEWLTMKTHPVSGYEFARALGFLPEASLDVVLYHHERWDGKGYPRGLAGRDIPIGGRIFAVADVFDALVSARPYKPAWSLDEARDEIDRQAGIHFDPEVVSAFLLGQRRRR